MPSIPEKKHNRPVALVHERHVEPPNVGRWDPNHVLMGGRVRKRPKLVHYENGDCRSFFTIENQRRFLKPNGRWHYCIPSRFVCVAHQDLAKEVRWYLRGGFHVMIQGQMSMGAEYVSRKRGVLIQQSQIILENYWLTGLPEHMRRKLEYQSQLRNYIYRLPEIKSDER